MTSKSPIEEKARTIYEWNAHGMFSAPSWDGLNQATKAEIIAAASLPDVERIAAGKWLRFQEMGHARAS